MQAPLTFILAFVAVLALIAALAWGLRRFAGNRLGANTNRGRMPRLAVIDAAAVDGRRRLVLVRRDNIEHLLMIGGPTDIVVEPNIVRAMPARDQMAARPAVGGGELPPRIAPLPDAGHWSDGDGARADAFDHAEPQLPEPPPRPARPSFVDEVRRTAPPLPERAQERSSERRSDPLLAGFSPEPLSPRAESRPEPRIDMRNEPPVAPPRPPRAEPMMPRPARPIDPPKPPPLRAERPAAPPPPPPIQPVAAAPAPTASLSAADQNLAEMAQRLEAALRRPVESSEPRIGAPPVAPEPPPSRPAPRVEPPAPPPVAAAPAKSGFENLEDEMASLLGRPKSPS
ncbi:flagellar biosynthetic protein FliO [Bradyrhizobium sp. S69]|uniref:flagellar biosynthetic protein FliO n=1 Tax=Bradyrhizobium sp. S69 TaxID=1641856 RepID=UPI00131DBE38|nr:flagellar biosynthetic protein FliO [Bradyrhizobium sp. S69]